MNRLVRFTLLAAGIMLLLAAFLSGIVVQPAAAQAKPAFAAITTTPTDWVEPYLANSRLLDMTVNDARLTVEAASEAYSDDPAFHSVALTQANGTLQAMATVQVVATTRARNPTLVPTPVPGVIRPGFPTPVPAPATPMEAVGLVGLGAVFGVILGGPIGILLGLGLGRRRS